MEKDDKKLKLDTTEYKMIIFHPADAKVQFVPWEAGERGEQAFIKLKRKDEIAFLYGGDKSAMKAEIQKSLFKLTNEGWEIQGEINIEFNGRQEDEFEELFHRDIIRLELGLNLLPLVDPNQGAPLLKMVKDLRKEIAQATGFVTPGIRVVDNLNILPNNYVIYIKETPVAMAEIFLDRLLAVGPLENLNAMRGWATRDPAFNNPAKWLEPQQKDEAEVAGCVLMGPLNVLITHLRETIVANLKELLGLQEVKMILDRLAETHPIVVEDFVKDKNKIRLVRKILQNLVGERVSIRDIVTIMETIGDYEEELKKTDMVTEMVRIALARQICWTYINDEGKIPALVLSRKFEDKIQNSIRETKYGLRLVLTTEEVDSIIRNIRKTLEDFNNPAVVFCDPPSRLYFRRLTEPSFPQLGILSTAEIMRGVKIEILGEIDLPSDICADSKEKKEQDTEEQEKKETRGFFSFLK